MRSFLKYTLATLTGILLSSILFFLFLVMIIAVSTSDKPVEAKPNSILLIKLNDRIVDRAIENPLDFLPTGVPAVREMGLNDILDNIRKAKKDDNITGIYLQLASVNAGMGTTEEIRNALLDFRESGKFIVAFGDVYTQKTYYLASVADSVFMNPEGNFLLTGLGTEILFFKGALDKLGIEPQVIRHGEYKSAVEPFINEEMSPESREQTLIWISSIWDNMLEGIVKERGLEKEDINQMAEELTIITAADALENGFIDRLKYKDEVIDALKELTGTELKNDLKAITLRKYTKVPSKRDYKGIAKDKIAVIYAHGDIRLGNMGEGTISSERISKAIRQARRDSSVKAIVLRVNSGGGGTLASDIIWREVELASKTKPLVASMGDVAASGGYYILAPAHYILAQANTITGSIGVWAIIPNMKSFFNKKLGITSDVAETNTHADFGSPFRSLSADEKAVLQSIVEDTYDTFLERVSNGRQMSPAAVDAIGGGRVWSGENALENGLIDAYGGLHDAIEKAAELAELEKFRIQSLPKLEDPIEQFIRELTENTRARVVKKELGQFYPYFETLHELEGLSGVQARLPFRFELH
ncbi:signal peptide peptidase SppA [Bacteroidota bacterium]